MGQPNLNFLSNERLDLLRDRKISEGLNDLKSSVKDMDIDVSVERPAPAAPQTPDPRYTKESLSQMARRLYRENVKPVIDEPKVDSVPDTYALRVNGKALAKALVNMRNPDNGDEGSYAPPAGPNGGNMTGPTGTYHALTTSMTLEEYEDYISKKFLVEDEVEVEEVVQEPELLVEKDPAITELESRLVEMADTSWVAIDKLMRQVAREFEKTPKQLHKEFKAYHGMIPDDWADENMLTEECGWMPLEEAVALNKVGQVFEVTYMYRCVTKRVKFFWPQVDYPSQQDMQDVVNMLYPGARVLAYYPSTHCGDNKDNFMILVGPSTPRAIVMKKEDWVPMTKSESLAYETIVNEEGEPTSPPMMTDNGVELWIQDHDTGEERVVLISEGLEDDDHLDVLPRFKIYPSAYTSNTVLEGKKGLWDNIHAKRKRGESPAKPGDKGYPKTLNVEATGDVTGHGPRLDTAYHYDMQDDGIQTGDIKNRKIKSGKKRKLRNEDKNPCWDGYKRKPGTKKFDKGSCVKEGEKKEWKDPIHYALKADKKLMDLHTKDDKKKNIKEDMSGMSQKSGDKRSTESGAGMTAQGVAKYNRRTGGNLKTAVTTPPSKLKPGSKSANRRKSFCARSRGWNGERGKAARRRWNC